MERKFGVENAERVVDLLIESSQHSLLMGEENGVEELDLVLGVDIVEKYRDHFVGLLLKLYEESLSE